MMGLVIFGFCRLWEPLKQGCRGSNVLASPSKVWEVLVVLDDPSVHITGDGVCTPIVSVASYLALKLHTLLL
jgi:hypothetical protein